MPASVEDKPQHFIRQWRKYRKMTQEDLAAAVGVSTATISQVETGKQGFTDTTLYAIASALKCTAGELLTRAPLGADEFGVMSVVPLMGFVGAGAEVEPDFEQVPDNGLDQVEVPFDLPADMIALEVRGDSMLPMYDPGTIIVVYREQRRSLESFYGQRAVVRTTDGRRFIKTIIKGEGGRVSLLSWNAQAIQDVEVAWVGEIFTYFPATAVRHIAKKIERQGGIQGRLQLKTG